MKFHVENVKNLLSVKIAVKYANVDKVWTGVTPRLDVSVNLAGRGRTVLSIPMSVIIKPYVEMKKSAKTLKGLTSAIVESVLK